MKKLILLLAIFVLLTSGCYEGAPGTPTLFMGGDSIMADSIPSLEPRLQEFNRTAAWGQVGANSRDAIPIFEYMRREHPMERVVVNLGANDVVGLSLVQAKNSMQRILGHISMAQCVVWVGVKETGVTPFYHSNWRYKARNLNAWLRNRPGVIFVDWETVSNGHPEYFLADGLHLSSRGQMVYNQQIVNVVSTQC